jgi:hypothetical protein
LRDAEGLDTKGSRHVSTSDDNSICALAFEARPAGAALNTNANAKHPSIHQKKKKKKKKRHKHKDICIFFLFFVAHNTA